MEVEILGVKFDAKMSPSEHMLTLVPLGDWSFSSSATTAKEGTLFKRARRR